MKNQGIIVAFSVMLMIGIPLFFGTTSAQNRMPGVSVGDSFKYTFDSNLNLGDSSFDLPSLLEGLQSEAQNIDFAQATVIQVSGSTVTMQTTIQYKNGTQQSDTGSIDVATGQDTTQKQSINMLLIAANLNPGDQIYSDGISGTINDTVTKTYPSGNRQVNHQNIVMNYNVSQEELADFGITTPLQQTNTQDLYWDKQTGALTEMTYKMVTKSTQINADISINVALTESNTFTIPEYPITPLLAVLVLVISAITITKIRFRSSK
jgi:hypothetical protein